MKFITFLFILFFSSDLLFAQDDRSQMPNSLQRTYFEVNLGSINYNFGASQFEALPNYKFQSVEVPHFAVRLVLYGYEFNKYIAAQISYMRPVYWVNYTYTNANYTQKSSVWMNVAGLSIKTKFPIVKNVSVFSEFGLGIITRHGGVSYSGATVVKDASYTSFLLGGGLKYDFSRNRSLLLSYVYSPEKSSVNQPATSFVSAGFSYHLHSLVKEKVLDSPKKSMIQPKHLFQIGYSSLIFGYGINNSFSKIPIFWGGDTEVNNGVSFNYQRNIFHGTRFFSLNWGIGASFWQSNIQKERFFTLSAYPVFKFNLLNTKSFDTYLYYSIAGPSYISKTVIDGIDTGKKFTFQDNMGVGFLMGENRNYNVEFKIGHYSNGNLFTTNGGVKIPFTVNLGYAF